MAQLHDALKALGPIPWDQVPQDSLSDLLAESFTAGELICNSLPALPNGTPFETATPHYDSPNAASSSSEIHASSARTCPPHESHEALQKSWGKPVSVKAAINPHNASIYKMAGNDRHGAWFARRSVHEGLGFDKFRKAMQREFSHSLAVTGGPGAGAVRGIAADRRLEKFEVEDKGMLQVYELSAQFPGPTTPREFLAMVMTTEDALSDKSAAQTEGGSRQVPRNFMIVSRPLEHPDAPQRNGFVRGQYESVEMIREIPLHLNKPTPAANGSSEKIETPAEAELNPVEWIMITRSDPGGGIPRFLVDRGTPESMLGDLNKFFDWACGMDVVPGPDADLDKQEAASKQEGVEQQDSAATSVGAVDGASADGQPSRSAQISTGAPSAVQTEQGGGILAGIGNTLHAGMQAYAPTAVTSRVDSYLYSDTKDVDSDSSDSDDTSSGDSFMSAKEGDRSVVPSRNQSDSMDNLSLAGGVSEMKDKKDMNSHEKEVYKLMQKQESLDRKLARKRLEAEEKLQKSKDRDQNDVDKVQEKLDRELQKTEEKHKKEIEKLERKKEKETRKAEQRRRKKDDASNLSRVSRERDEFRSQSDLVKRQNLLLVSQVEDLQAEVLALTQRLTNLGGPDAVKGVAEEVSTKHKRGASNLSIPDSGSRPLSSHGGVSVAGVNLDKASA